jgi:aspartokinase/homoserine dehydrogenase 1
MTHASMDAGARAVAGITDSLVRLSVGIESPHDLVRDLTEALDAVLEVSDVVCPTSIASVSVSSQSDPTDVVLLGVGAIGRELISQVAGAGSGGASRHLRICGIVDRSGYVFAEGGLSPQRLAELSKLKSAGQPLVEAIGGRPASALQAVREIGRSSLVRPILVDATAADTMDVLQFALSHDFDLVLANKVPLAAKQADVDTLQAIADRAGRTILHEATVGAGLPVIDTLRKLLEAGDEIVSIEGCPSGTLGYLFGELGRGERFSVALRRAIERGYAEPDPRIDLSGLDVARKALILARAIGFRGELFDVNVESLVPDEFGGLSRASFLDRVGELDAAWAERAAVARNHGNVLRYRTHVTASSIVVGLAAVRATDRLGVLHGTDNQFTFTTRRYRTQPLVISGPGAGPAVTAAGVYNDLLHLERSRDRRDPNGRGHEAKSENSKRQAGRARETLIR